MFSVFHHLQKDKQRKQRHSLKIGKKRRESSNRNYYIISPRVIIKAIIIICVLIYMNTYIFHICFILFLLLSISNIWFCMLDVIIGRHTRNCQICTHMHTGYTHTGTHTKKKTGKGKKQKTKKEGGGWVFRGVEERGYWGGQDLILITLDRHECFSVFHHLQEDKQRKQRHSLKLGKKRRESSKRNYYIISPRVIIKAIIIISLLVQDCWVGLWKLYSRSKKTFCALRGQSLKVVSKQVQ